MPDNPYQIDGQPKITGVRKATKSSRVMSVIAYVSAILFAVFVFCFLVFPEQLEEIAMAWSMFKDPNQFADYTLAYRIGIPACLFLFANGILCFVLAKIFRDGR